MEDKKSGMSLEEISLKRVASILKKLPSNGKNIDWDYLENECKKIEVCSSIA